ncbi:hypothetical protein ONV78_28985 [Hahella sp. CR1]|uniref:hypothetical protein n=1 Tax=Hahella sp. CR1 TaxID=2992807 RepID=UPI0024421270|nr:hypothetical protein [Hahella sp. CR1]MDG9671806.1 hypothetical protein [Hahella sp. CR1]
MPATDANLSLREITEILRTENQITEYAYEWLMEHCDRQFFKRELKNIVKPSHENDKAA